jgi:predicted transcriptional regulator
MLNFLFGYFIGRNQRNEVIEPTEKTKSQCELVLEYIHSHPHTTCSEISSNLKMESYSVNAYLIKLLKTRKIQRTEDKRYYI